MTTRALRNALLAALASALALHGYKLHKANAEFTKKTGEGWFKFQLVFLPRSTGVEINPVMLIRKHAVEDLYHQASYFAPPYHHSTPTIGTSIAQFLQDGQDYRFPLSSEAGLAACHQGLLSLFQQIVLPFFAHYDCLEALEQEVNCEDRPSRFSGPKYEGTVGIILAKLVQSPLYEQLVSRYRRHYQGLANGFYLPEYEGVLHVLQAL